MFYYLLIGLLVLWMFTGCIKQKDPEPSIRHYDLPDWDEEDEDLPEDTGLEL
jgi:hypothetical protein